MVKKARECILLASCLADWVQRVSISKDALMCHHLFLTIRGYFSHIWHMIDTRGVIQGEKNVRLKEIRLTFINGLCLCKCGKRKNVEGCLSELHFSFRSTVISAVVWLL